MANDLALVMLCQEEKHTVGAIDCEERHLSETCHDHPATP